MSPYRRNIIVGITVLAAMGALGWMILKFGGSIGSAFTPPTMPIDFIATRADGVGAGSPVLYQGVTVGRITDVRRDPNMRDVLIKGEVDIEPPLPANVVGEIRAQSLLGSGSAISLALTGPVPEGTLKSGTHRIPAKYVGLDVLPKELADLSTALRDAAIQLRESNLIGNLNTQVTKAGEMMESVNSLVGDQKMQEDLKTAIANMRTATDSANRIAGNLEKFSSDLDALGQDAQGTITQVRTTVANADQKINSLSEQVAGRLEQTSKLLETFQSISTKIDTGKGTGGQLVNDPRLYESLVDTAQQLNKTVSDLQRLMEQWEQEGVSLKLN